MAEPRPCEQGTEDQWVGTRWHTSEGLGAYDSGLRSRWLRRDAIGQDEGCNGHTRWLPVLQIRLLIEQCRNLLSTEPAVHGIYEGSVMILFDSRCFAGTLSHRAGASTANHRCLD
jgi:hypothetical protein